MWTARRHRRPPTLGHPLVIGHRGASGRLPENTIAAFRAAIDDGADGIELDVRSSLEGVAVVVHDATLRRTAGLRVRVSSLTVAELACFDVPTLDDVFAATARAKAIVYVELKTSDDALLRSVAGTLSDRQRRSRSIVLSFNHASLRRLRAVDDRIRIAVSLAPSLRRPRPSASHVVETVERSGAIGAALHHSLVTRRVAQSLAERGLESLVWTVNRSTVAARLARLGVTSVMTDHPSRIGAGLLEATP